MEEWILPLIGGILSGLVIGIIIVKSIEKSKSSKLITSTKKEADTILKEARVEAEVIKKDKILQAKERFIELKSEHEKVILQREKSFRYRKRARQESEFR